MPVEEIAPVDTNVKVPPAVRAIAEAAEAAHRAAYQPQQPEPDAAAPEVKPEGQEQAPQTVELSPPTVPVKTDAVDANDQVWEHRYKSMKGRYDRLQEQLRAMSEQISYLQTQQTAPRTERKETAPEPAPLTKLITPQEEQDYGTEFLSVVGKRAKEELSPEVTELKRKLDFLEAKLGNVGTHVESDARSRMESSLDQQIPNWRDVNFDPEFMDWLKLPDAYSGAIRHDLLRAAYEQNRTPQVQAFFKGFLSEKAAVTPAGANGAARVSGNQADSQETRPSLEQYAAPGRAKTAAGSTPPAEKPIITRAQIDRFYKDVAAGSYRGRDGEKDRAEQMIFEAMSDGRIR
jgi:hypothetical protein